MEYTGSERMRKRKAEKEKGKKRKTGSVRREVKNPTNIAKIRAKDLTRTKRRKNRNLA